MWLFFGAIIIVFITVANIGVTVYSLTKSGTAVDTQTGRLVDAGTGRAVSVSEALTPLQLTSYLPDTFFSELRYFTATSPTGTLVKLTVSAFMRLPAQQCLPPIVKLITSVGAVHIEGSTLEFAAANVNPFFLEAGFLTDDAGPGRRRLSAATLMGFFNSVEQLEASTANSTRPTCLPDLPEQPWRLRARSKERKLCQDCHDEEGFLLDGLIGIETVEGRPFAVFEEATRMDTVLVGNLNVTMTKTVRRYPRFPQLYVHEVFNGTHDLKWVDFEGTKFHCHSSQARANSTRVDVDSSEQAPLVPSIRYEGFTYYSSDRFTDVASLMYTMSWPEMRIKQEYFATGHDVNIPLGLRMYDFNEHVQQYEISHEVDFWDVAIGYDAWAPGSELFNIPSIGDCIPDEGMISLPPHPEEEYIGVGHVTSDQAVAAWGETLPPSYWSSSGRSNSTDSWGDLPPPPSPSPPPPAAQPLPPPPPPPSPSPPMSCVDQQVTGYRIGSSPATCTELAAYCTHASHGPGIRSVCPVTCDACQLCSNTCNHAFDGDCDDGGPGMEFSICQLGSDCGDCHDRFGSIASGRRLDTSAIAARNGPLVIEEERHQDHGRELTVAHGDGCIEGALGYAVHLPNADASIQLVKDFCQGEVRVDASGTIPLTPLLISGSAGVNYYRQSAFGEIKLSVGCKSVLNGMARIPRWAAEKVCGILNLGDDWLYGIGRASVITNLFTTCQTGGNAEGINWIGNGRALGLSLALGAQLEVSIPATWWRPAFVLAKAAAEIKMTIRRSPVPYFGAGGVCDNTCHYASDGDCDDGGEGAEYGLCTSGSDCHDCGQRGGNDEGKFFIRIFAEASIKVALYNWGREKKFERRLYPSRPPGKNSRTCRANRYWIKDSANAESELYQLWGAW